MPSTQAGAAQVEYHLVVFDPVSKTVRIACIAPAVLQQLQAEDDSGKFAHACTWHPEYGSWMVEATPAGPYGRTTSDLRTVEGSLAFRRARIRAVAGTILPHTAPLSTVAFPMMGVGQQYMHPAKPIGGFHSRSHYFSDFAISPHPRFGTLTANIRRRRGERVCILLPVFPDTATDRSAPVLALDEASQPASKLPPLLQETVPAPTANDVHDDGVAEAPAEAEHAAAASGAELDAAE